MSAFADFRNGKMQDPKFLEAYEDAQELAKTRDALVCIRRAQKIPQAVVAQRMGVGQSTVSEFENSANDPRISTLQRYARAVLARLDLKVSMPVEAAWATTTSAEQWMQQRNVKPLPERSLRALELNSTIVKSSTTKVEAWRQAREAAVHA